MAKKKKGSVRSKKRTAAPAAAAQAGPAKKSNTVLLSILAVFVLFTAAEIYFISAKSMRESKRPEYVTSWTHNYKGCTSMGEYGDYIYGVDNTRGDVYRHEKTTGNLVKVFSFPEGAYTALENSKGDIYALTKTNEVYQIDGKTYKTIRKIKPADAGTAIWMEVDSKDNFFIANSAANTVTKYGPDFEKILTFGGNGGDKASLNAIGKLFAGPGDNIYVMNNYKPGGVELKIYDNNGKFLRAWPFTKIKKFDSLTNMCVANDGNVYINAYEESMIYVFSGTGKFLGKFDGDKDKKFQIISAASVTGGKNGVIYVHTHKIAAFKTIKY